MSMHLDFHASKVGLYWHESPTLLRGNSEERKCGKIIEKGCPRGAALLL
jgi:hypothetical protein